MLPGSRVGDLVLVQPLENGDWLCVCVCGASCTVTMHPFAAGCCCKCAAHRRAQAPQRTRRAVRDAYRSGCPMHAGWICNSTAFLAYAVSLPGAFDSSKRLVCTDRAVGYSPSTVAWLPQEAARRERRPRSPQIPAYRPAADLYAPGVPRSSNGTWWRYTLRAAARGMPAAARFAAPLEQPAFGLRAWLCMLLPGGLLRHPCYLAPVQPGAVNCFPAGAPDAPYEHLCVCI
jgi:hypothetical protein